MKRKVWTLVLAVTVPLVLAGCPPVKQPVKVPPPTTTTEAPYPPSP